MSEEDIIEVLTPPKSYIGVDGARHFEDTQGKCVNTSGGIRITTDQPKNHKRTIFIAGGCTQFGTGVRDNATTASCLQRLFNERIPEQNLIVQNYGFYLWNFKDMEQDFFNILKSIPAKPNDIILHYLLTRDNTNTSVIDLYNYGNRPHDYGEIFFDQSHLTENGHRLTAEKLYDELIKMQLFNETNYTIAPPEKALHGTPSSKSDNDSNNTPKELIEYKNLLCELYNSMFAIKIGAIVMNCNPFTLGHRYLIEQAAAQVNHLFIFVVQEDKSVFPFADRLALVDAGTTDFNNITVLPSGSFIISSLTFSEYFNKQELQDRVIDSSQDVTIFAKEIAPCLNITIRFAGEEPFDNVTKQYNDTMRSILPQYGIEFIEIPRKEFAGNPISASRVRALLEMKNFDEIAKIVPKTTFDYLSERFSF